MKLRNKNTGEIGVINLKVYGDDTVYCYEGLEYLSAEWEDAKPKEPLIKDEKIRKAIRAWAEANGVDRAILGQVNNDELAKKSPMTDFGCHISFEGSLGLERGRNYTITELCGEEE